MKSSEYIAILQSKVVIDKEIAASLESIIEEYPFFQSARAVSLKYLHDQGSFRYNSNLKLTAAHTLDRTVLFNYITSPGFKALENIEPVWSHVYVEPVKEEKTSAEEENRFLSEPEFLEVVPENAVSIEESAEEIVEETSLHTPEYVKEILIEGIDVLESDSEDIDSESIAVVDAQILDHTSETQFFQELAQTNELEWVADVQEWKNNVEHTAVERIEQLTPEEELELQEEQDFEHRDWFEHRIIEAPVVEEEESKEIVVAEDLVSEENLETVSEPIAQEVSVAASSPIVSEETFVEEINTPEVEEAVIEKPIQFNKNEKHSFQEWLQLTAIKPIEREELFIAPVTTPELPDVKKKKMDLIDRFINLNPRMPKATAYDSSSQENIVSGRVENDTALMTETLAQVYLQQKKYDRAIQAYEILILKYPEKSSFFADRIKDVKILKKDNTNK